MDGSETHFRDDVYLVTTELGWCLHRKEFNINTCVYSHDSRVTPEQAYEAWYQVGNLPKFHIYDKDIVIP